MDAATPVRSIAPPPDERGVVVLARSEAGYLDGVESRLLEMIAAASDLRSVGSELFEAAESWPERYHTDPARANVLRALDLPATARVLEVGAGCGAITRYLGETCAVVDAVEPVVERAAVARARTRDLGNVAVFAGELGDLPDEPAYDVVVVVGVLEYVGAGSGDAAPYLAFLQEARRRLVPGGVLVLAIENRLGVKYFTGSPEDHTGRLFDSIEGYPHGTHARTFSRMELLELVDRAGFEGSDALGVFPDYKMTRTVLDVARLVAVEPDLAVAIPRFPSEGRGSGTVKLADERLVWRELVGAGVAADFSNSMLVLAHSSGSAPTLWPAERLAAYFSNARRPHYRAQTSVFLDGGRIRFSREFDPEPGPLMSLESKSAEYTSGRVFPEVFADADDDERAQMLAEWRQLLIGSTNDRGLPFDGIPSNVVIGDDGVQRLIDIEFRSTRHELAFVEFRGVFWLANVLAQQTSPALWPDLGTVGDLVQHLLGLAGLPATRRSISANLAREAEVQAELTTIFSGPGAVARWATELELLLDREMRDLPLGERIHEQFNRALSEHDLAQAQLGAELAAFQEAHAASEADAAGMRHLVEVHAAAAAAAEAEVVQARNEHAATLGDLRAERERIAAIESSRGYRGLRLLRRAVDRAAPWGTHRRGLYERAMKAGVLVRRRIGPGRRTVPLVDVPVVPFASEPLVSIVIPIHGKWSFTAQCLASIVRAHDDHIPIEVVVVDDASPDGSRAFLSAVSVGFTRAANAGLAAARGTHVVMLNNDVEVMPGWLAALLDAGSGDDVGLVGAKLVYPDGRLQEAGGIIFADGNGWNYGKFQDPGDPRFNFRKDVDYCSGAAILLTSRLLDVVPAFDERYAPAYYEDADLAFEARAHGLRVVYEPAAVVVHHEGISHGADESQGIKRFQVVNREKFAQKWAGVLGQQYAGADDVERAAIRRAPLGTVVIVDHMVPRWRHDAGSLRMQRILLLLRGMGYDVIFVPQNRDPYQPVTRELQAAGILVWYSWADLWGYLRAVEPEVAVVLLSRAEIAAEFIRHFRVVLPEVPIVFDTVDLHFLREQRRADLGDAGGSYRAAATTRELELALVRAAEATIVVSDVEVGVLHEMVPDADVSVLPLVHDSIEPATDRPRSDVTFVGSFQHDPNADAARWLVTEIFPLVHRRAPSLRLTIVGLNPPADLIAAAPPWAQFLHWVEDLDDVHARTAVSVAPLRYGAGVKGKVADAWAHGVPVVMTAVAAEGMDVEDGQVALLADTAEDFAEAIVRVATDPDLWARLSAGGRAHVDRLFGSGAIRERLSTVIERVRR